MRLVLGVCKERNLSPSRYLLCAAYGAALGGEWTLIGTRSSIIVSDFLRQRTGQGIGFFDFTPIAATVFVGCATYFFLVGRRFLPKAAVQSLEQELGKEYLTEVMVTPQRTRSDLLSTNSTGRSARILPLSALYGRANGCRPTVG